MAGTATARRASSGATRARTSAFNNGVRDGSLTHGEANRLEHGQNRINRYEARARSDGVVTPGERGRIDGMQNRESRQIYADRHNDRTATARPTTPTSGTPAGNGSHNWGNGGWQHGSQAGNTTPTTPTTGTPPTGGSRNGGNGGWQHAPQAGNTPPTTPAPARSHRRLAQLGQRQRRLPHAAGGGHAAAAGTGAASDHDARVQPAPRRPVAAAPVDAARRLA